MDPVSHPSPPRGSQGFTLIELMIVVVIIGILATFAVQGFDRYRESSRNAAVKSDLRNAMAAEEAYFSDWLQYVAFSVGPGGSTTTPEFSASPNVSITATVTGTGVTIVGDHAATTTTWCMSTATGVIVEGGSC